MPFANNLSFKPEIKEKKESTLIQKLFSWITSSGKRILIMTELVVITGLLTQTYFVRQLNEINKSIADSKKFVTESADIENQFRVYVRDINFLKKVHAERTLWSEAVSSILKEVTVQRGIGIESIEFKPNQVAFVGVAKTTQAFAFLIQALLSQSDTNKLVINGSSYQPKDKAYTFSLILVKK